MISAIHTFICTKNEPGFKVRVPKICVDLRLKTGYMTYLLVASAALRTSAGGEIVDSSAARRVHSESVQRRLLEVHHLAVFPS